MAEGSPWKEGAMPTTDPDHLLLMIRECRGELDAAIRLIPECIHELDNAMRRGAEAHEALAELEAALDAHRTLEPVGATLLKEVARALRLALPPSAPGTSDHFPLADEVRMLTRSFMAVPARPELSHVRALLVEIENSLTILEEREREDDDMSAPRPTTPPAPPHKKGDGR
jgi:hypothetical protein